MSLYFDQKFFFDTADVEYIKNCWNKLEPYVYKSAMMGVTTNPNALSKVNCKTMSELEKLVRKLCGLVSEIRGRNNFGGEVHVQLPNSDISQEDAIKFVKQISCWRNDDTEISLKIPPFKKYLELVDNFSQLVNVNVTGVADCSTALRCFTYNVKYVSIIPGRMEEKGINAKEQIQFANQYKQKQNTRIIAGSMRTLEGLQSTIENNTIPTIGSRVFDLIVIDEETIKKFANMWNVKEIPVDYKFSPLITQDMTDLSIAFFEQMDELGKSLYEDFLAQ